ncbi:MAG: hypothetical protein J7604_10950 [Sporocytophaga sp.]|uniref:hypothetical protein n=1 Tax=Sporocytophaga sp. TaxID=2231183 RepID=UPI001B090CFB|nr:hypothetical protein [Sporocytophaga sp.]MBO9700717.1 hypothetical protein [Sporocytophaga sp.]
MRALVIFVILFSFSFAELVGYLYWENRRFEAKEDAISAIESNSEPFVCIAVKKDNFTSGWNKSKEFLHNGMMYDVVSSEINKDSIVFLCFQDINETWIEREVEKCISNFFGKSGQKKKHNFYGKYAVKKLIQVLEIGLEDRIFLKHYKFNIDYIFHYQLMIVNAPFVPPEFKS